MKINIDLIKLGRKNLTINQYLLLLKIYYQGRDKEIAFREIKSDYLFLRDSKFLTIDGSTVTLTKKAINLIEGIGERDYEDLAESIRELFPKGAKAGKWPWRSSIRDLSDRLRKLDKSDELGNYSNDEILSAAASYVNRFTTRDMDAGMQICKYFINKDGSSTLLDILSMQEDKIEEIKSTTIKL